MYGLLKKIKTYHMKKLILTLCILSCGKAYLLIPKETSVWQDYQDSTQSQLRGLSSKGAIKQRALILDVELFRNQLSIAKNNQLSSRTINPAK